MASGAPRAIASALNGLAINAVAGPSRRPAVFEARRPLRSCYSTARAVGTRFTAPVSVPSGTQGKDIDWANLYDNITHNPERSIVFDLPDPVNHHGRRIPFKKARQAAASAAVDAANARPPTQEELDQLRRDRADPFYVIANSDRRRCGLTRAHMPKLNMIKLSLARTPGPVATRRTFLLPDMILSDKRTKIGFGLWVICRKHIYDDIPRQKSYGKMLRAQMGSMDIPSRLSAMVQDQLEERVVLEAKALRDGMDLLRRQAKPARCVQLADPDDFDASFGTEAGENIRAFFDLRDSKGETEEGETEEGETEEGETEEGDTEEVVLAQEGLWPVTMRDTRPVPTYVLSSLLPPARFAQVKDHLAAAANAPVDQCTGIALSTWPAWSPKIYGVQLAIALWRMRLWYGHGWRERIMHPRAAR